MVHVKRFVLGTEWSEATANSLLSLAVADLRRKAGFIPPILPDDAVNRRKMSLSVFDRVTNKNINLWCEEFSEKFNAGASILADDSTTIRCLWRYWQWYKTLDAWKRRPELRAHEDWIMWYEYHTVVVDLAFISARQDRQIALRADIDAIIEPLLYEWRNEVLFHDRDEYAGRLEAFFDNLYYTLTGQRKSKK